VNLKSEEKDKDFSKIPHFMIDSGLLAELRPSEIKVFLVINRFADYKTGIAYPTVKKISELSGINKDNIAKATRSLVQKGLIEKRKTGERFRFRNWYRVTKLKSIYSDLPSCIVPKKTGKCREIPRGKDGKFIPIPKNTDNGIPQNTDSPIPSFTESDTCPQNTEKKENLEICNRDNIIRDNVKETNAFREKQVLESVSQEKEAETKISEKKIISKSYRKILGVQKRHVGLDQIIKVLRDQGYGEEEIEKWRMSIE